MMHQEHSPSHMTRAYTSADVFKLSPLSMLVYRSRAVRTPTEPELETLVRDAQARNGREAITGLLIYDQGTFYQWLEGPSASIARVWSSIKHDPRHCDVEILREQVLPKRHFPKWHMRLARRTHERFKIPAPVQNLPPEFVDGRLVPPIVFSIKAWDEILEEVVIPGLKLVHQADARAVASVPLSASVLWHPRVGAVRELAELLRAVDVGNAGDFINSLVAQGASLNALYQELFEPAARFLGGLWYEDRCTEIDVTMSMSRLQFLARRLSERFEKTSRLFRPGHAVLVVPQPGEAHMLSAGMASELFWRAGWDVSCEFPGNDADLEALVHDHWFDALELSTSTALRREHRLGDIGDTILAAQNASMNRSLAIIVDGRVFVERPQSSVEVGADAGCISVVDCVPAAERLVTSLALRTAS